MASHGKISLFEPNKEQWTSTLTIHMGEKIFLLGSTNVQVYYQSQCASLPLLVVP